MVNTVSLACANYFKGFQDLSTFNKNDSCKNTSGILKVASYFTIVMPLLVGLIYAISSLIGRVSVKNSQSPGTQKISAVSRQVFGQTFEEQLQLLFKSSTQTQKLFTIDGNKIGIIVNPTAEPFQVAFMTILDPMVLVSDKPIPDEIERRIKKWIPDNWAYTTLSVGSINGYSTFAVLGFE